MHYRISISARKQDDSPLACTQPKEDKYEQSGSFGSHIFARSGFFRITVYSTVMSLCQHRLSCKAGEVGGTTRRKAGRERGGQESFASASMPRDGLGDRHGAALWAAELPSCQRATLWGAASSVPTQGKGRECEPHSKSR